MPFLPVVLRCALLLLAGYAAICLYLYWRQEGLLFLPEQASLDTVRREAQAAGFRLWPSDDDGYRALLAEPIGPAVGTCLLWHGNAGSARQRGYLTAPLLRQGWRVIVAEYPGYGARPAGNRRETVLVGEARELATVVQRHFGGPLVVVGESLGAALASAVAGDATLPIQGALLLTPWQELAGPAHYHYPWLPVSLLLRDRFDNAAALANYRGAVLVITAGADEIIPPAEGRRLFQALPTPRKRLHEIPGAYHNDWVERMATTDWQDWLEFAAGVSSP